MLSASAGLARLQGAIGWSVAQPGYDTSWNLVDSFHVVAIDAHHGQVKVNGEIWSARSYDETEVLEPGTTVTIMSISGATAVVWGGL